MYRSLLLLCLLLVAGVSAQESDEPDLSPTFKAQIETLTDYAETSRALTLPEPLPLHFPSRAELRTYLQNEFDLSLTEDVLAESMRFYAIFNWLPADTDLRALVETFYSSQIGGFYDPTTREMNVVMLSSEALGDRLPILEQIVYVHEYVHALQDANFDLVTYLETSQTLDNNDQSLARLALVEGDATRVMNDYTVVATQKDPIGVLAGLVLGGLQAGNLTLPAGTPDIITNELLFPYLSGEAFTRALVTQPGDFDALNSAFTSPPMTTEQVLHPDKYIAGELGEAVTVVNAAQKMGADWALMDEGVLGEFYLGEFFRTQLSDNDSADAAAGWGGDGYQIYQNSAGELAAQVQLVWDTPADRTEFLSAFAAYGQERFGTEADASGCFADAQQALCSNGRVLLIAPTVDLALSIVSE